MCAFGQKQTFTPQKVMSALPPRADIGAAQINVCLGPKTGHRPYSITSSANNRNDSGTVRPSPLAVFKFTTKLNLVGS